MPRRAIVCVLVTLFAGSASADVLPPGKKLVPRHIEIRDLDKTGDDILVLYPCYPAKGGSFAQDYCVIESSGPFRLQGSPYFLPKKRVHTELVKDSHGTKDAPPAVRILELSRYGVETSEFFEKNSLARKSGELRATDSMMLSLDSDIIRVSDVWRVVRGADGIAEVRAEKLVFQCITGEKLERALPRDPLREPLEIPTCPRDRKPQPAPSTSASVRVASETPKESATRSFPELAVAVGLGFLLIGGVAALASRKRAE